MLSKEECKKATTKWKDTIKKWQKEKATVKEINKIIDPTAVFNFSQADCKWINHNNKVSNFHAYAGIYDYKFILIIVPLDENGEEKTSIYQLTIILPLKKKIL